MTLTTMTTRIGRLCLLLGLVGLFLPALTSREALAQRTTADVTIQVTAGGGAPPSGVTVVVLNTDSGFAALATARNDGSHFVAGLAPGEYLITATQPGGKEVYRLVRVGVGQSATVGIDLGETPIEGKGETIVVEGKVSESTTSEIGVNVTREQIDNLPQNTRNFLNFAQLAPGVRLNQDQFRQELQAGAQAAAQTNIFIDGVSIKSQVLQGGTVGQDSSRGNPFPQLAVDQFRVITQNYKAEYEQAGSAVISAVTRTGGNEYHGDVFTQFQHDSLQATDFFTAERGDPKPDLSRYQVGAAAGGPIVKDKAFIFLTYEGNYQNRQNQVFLGGAPTPADQAQFGDFEGTFTSPFREHLGFGKFTWRPADNQNVDVSASLRTETDVRSFGTPDAQLAFDNAENVKNRVVTASARHQLWLGSVLHEATIQFLQNAFNPTAENFTTPGQEFHDGIDGGAPLLIKIGGRSSDQNIGQTSFTLRDDVTVSDISAGGQHVFKTGIKASFNHYKEDKQLDENPTFRYFRGDVVDMTDPANPVTKTLDFSQPSEAVFGTGDALVDANNAIFGLYVQDDWAIGKRLTLNLGVRWDVETNGLNNDYVTPQSVRDAMAVLAPMVEAANGPGTFQLDHYITDGRSDRPIFLGAVQPRVGFALDVLGDRNTTLFGGAGRYYDRNLFDDGVNEKYRLQHESRTFLFSNDGLPRNGQNTIQWMPQYQSAAGLSQLIEQGSAPDPEIFLLENDTKPVHTDHYSIGVRQKAGPTNATVTFTHMRSENVLGFYPLNRNFNPDPATGGRGYIDVPDDGVANVIASSDDRETRYTALQVTLEKPLSAEMSAGGISWGAAIAYTLGWARERGNQFEFDFTTPGNAPMVPTGNDERHRLILSGITVLPLDFTLSTFITLGSGLPFTIIDVRPGDTDRDRIIDRNGGRSDKVLEYKQIDARIGKSFKLVDQHRIDAFVECFNLFNWKNFGGYNGFIPVDGIQANPDYGHPNVLVGPPRAFQLGMAYHF
ncbi:MAG TPA: TonB-dependent receptor [Kofleriaceae bacterium]|nr:TonB-dependent receptor [Kofleriaceae bacterium]